MRVDLRDDERRFTLTRRRDRSAQPQHAHLPHLPQQARRRVDQGHLSPRAGADQGRTAGREPVGHQVLDDVPYVQRLPPVPHAGAVGGGGLCAAGQPLCAPWNEQSQDGKDKPGAKMTSTCPCTKPRCCITSTTAGQRMRTGSTRDVTALEDAMILSLLVRPRYWVADQEVETKRADYDFDWYLAFRDITNTTNERTAYLHRRFRYLV